MKRYILVYNTGEIVQQDGLNLTYMQMTSLGVLKMIFDTKEGTVQVGTKWEFHKIPSYSSSDLVTDIPKDNKDEN